MATDAGDQFWVKVFVVAVLSLMVLIPLLILGFMVLFGDDISEFSRMLNGG